MGFDFVIVKFELCLTWFKHIIFMMKGIGRRFKRDKSPLLEGLFTRELTHTQSYNNMSTSSKFIISQDVIKYTKLQNYGSYSLSVELINSCTA